MLSEFWALLAEKLGIAGGRARAAFTSFVSNWQPHEGGWTANNATYNPLNTSHVIGESNPINSYNIQAYPDIATGVEATAQTLNNGLYPNLMNALVSGDYSAAVPIQGDINTWVTGNRYTPAPYTIPLPKPTPLAVEPPRPDSAAILTPTSSSPSVAATGVVPDGPPSPTFTDEDGQGHMWSSARQTWVDRWGNWLSGTNVWNAP